MLRSITNEGEELLRDKRFESPLKSGALMSASCLLSGQCGYHKFRPYFR
jgi:hypothetical protein